MLRQPKEPRSNPAPPLPVNPPSRLLPLGALAAGFGLFNVAALAQTAPAPAAAASAPKSEATLPPVPVKAKVETDATSMRATTSTIGKGHQELRDISQSVTVITDRLMDDRRIDTLKEALHQTAGVTFLAAEGGEEDIRLRGFSLAASGDIYVDSLRDPAFYERDTFSFDRVELLRGSASMLFGRGSTGGVVNQVSKQALLTNVNQVDLTVGNGNFMRFGGDFNLKTSETSALRVNVMSTTADGGGGNDKLDKQGLAPTFRWGVGTNDEFYLAGYYLRNNNGINYGLPWLRKDSTQMTSANPSGIIEGLDPSLRRWRRAQVGNPPGPLFPRPARRHDPLLYQRERGQRPDHAGARRLGPDAGDRLDLVDARRAEQDPGHDDHLRSDRLQQQVHLVRSEERGADRRRRGA